MASKKSREGRALSKIGRALPAATEAAVVEFLKAVAKLEPFTAGGMAFAGKLRDAVRDIPEQERAEVMEALRRERLESIETWLNDLEVQGERTRHMAARASKAVAKLEEKSKGQELAAETILETMVSIHDTSRQTVAALSELRDAGGTQDAKLDRLLELLDDETRRCEAFRDFETKYLIAAQGRYGYLDLLGIPEHRTRKQPIDVGFIALSLASDGDGHPPRSAQSVFSEHRGLVVEGEAGAGKTTLMQWETYRCCRTLQGFQGTLSELEHLSEERNAPPIPFLIRLREMHLQPGETRAFPDPETWVKLTLPKFTASIPDDWLDTILREGRALLLLDGLDELPSDKRPAFWEELQDLIDTYPDLSFRVTSRYFPRTGDKANQWNPPSYPSAEAAVPTVKVQPLTPDRRDELIEQWYEAAVKAEPTAASQRDATEELEGYADNLKRRIRKPRYRRIFELAETPFLCAAICLINRHRNELLPEGRHELYRMLVVALLSLRDKMRKIKTDPILGKLGETVLVRLHAKLALEMLGGMKNADEKKLESERDEDGEEDGAYNIEAGREDVVRWLDEIIATIPALPEEVEAGDVLDFLVTRCGLLREPVRDRFDFRHRALQEYLGGSAAMRNIPELVNRADDDRWHDTIILAAGGYNVSEDEAKRLINELIDRGDREGLAVCYAVAVACLETAHENIDTATQNRALDKLGKLVPPKNAAEAKTLAAAGDAVVELLPHDADGEVETVAACAETLARIGSEAASEQLREGYWADTRTAVCREVIKSPGINPLAMPVFIFEFDETERLRLPEYALEYVTGLEPLENMSGFEALDLCDCEKISDLTPLRKLTELQRLNLTGLGAVTDVSPLGALSQLESLSLADCVGLGSVAGLAGAEGLEHLDLSRCASLGDLKGLEGLAKLKALSLRGCPKVTDLVPLASLGELQTLDLSYCTGVEDLAVLKALPKLRVLDTQGLANLANPPDRSDPSDQPVPGRDYIATVKGAAIRMVWIEGGTFNMGSPETEEGRWGDHEGPVHRVKVYGFWLSATPVTQEQYEAATGETPSSFEGPDRPVEEVSWNDAVKYCEGLGTGYGLPTEAQWEYAYRAGSQARYCFGDSGQRLGTYGWYDDNSGSETHDVGQKRPNSWGLYDMHGNVWEWCRDDWHDNYDGAPSDAAPWGDGSGSDRVLRGGSWNYSSGDCRCAIRSNDTPGNRDDSLGFRVARTP